MKRENINTTVTEFLSAFYPDIDETINLRTFGAKGAKDVEANTYQTNRKELSFVKKARTILEEANEKSGIYFVVNSGGNKDGEITRYNAFFAEKDELSIDEQHQALDNAPIQPSIRVETKRSVHAYWLIDGDCSEADWRDIQARLIEYFDGDKSIKNPSRCMRLPLFDHVSFDGEEFDYHRIEVVTFDPAQRFTVEAMKTAFTTPQISADANIVTNCDNVTSESENQTFENWDELNAELRKRIIEQARRNANGKYEMRCPVHNGASHTSLFCDPSTKAVKCVSGRCSHEQILEAFGLPTQPKKEEGDEDLPQSALLVNLAADAELFFSQNDEPFASINVNGHIENWCIESKNFKEWLGKKFYQTYDKKVASGRAVDEAISTLSGKAKFDGERKEVFVRRAEFDGAIYLDLVNDGWQVVKITAEGWEITNDCPVKFRRTRGMKSLPTPLENGSLSDLDRFLNIHGEDLVLVKAWLMTALKTNIPYPILVFASQQNCGKSTSARVLCDMIDPHQAFLLSKPKSEEDLFIAVSNRLTLAIDNLSYISEEFSDSLCRIATGGAYTKRKLYSDGDETILTARNPLILTGIGDIATRGDLISRSIIISLPTIIERTSEADFWERFREAQPRILGALLSAVSEGLKNFDLVKVVNCEARMLDFAKFGTAAESVLGLKKGEFVEICNKNYENANKVAMENNPVGLLINQLMQNRDEWTGTASILLTEIFRLADDVTRRNPAFPKSPQKLSNLLYRIAPSLLMEDIEIDKGDHLRQGGTGARLIRISKVVKIESSQSSQLSQTATTEEGFLF